MLLLLTGTLDTFLQPYYSNIMAQSNSPAKQFIIKISSGLIRTESQAMLVIVGIFILSMLLSVFLLYKTFAP